MSIEIINDHLTINGHKLESHTIIKKLGEGANGIVYLAKNKLLEREEALKIWIKQRKNDKRDKSTQAIFEAAKQASNNGKYAVQIFYIGELDNVIYALMEYVDGITLKEFCEQTDSAQTLVDFAYKYLKIIESITTSKTIHGDPHWKNVLIYHDHINRFQTNIEMKLCDFGTSHFSSKEISKNRHWSIVKETVINMTKNLKQYEEAREFLEYLEEGQQQLISSLDKGLHTNISERVESQMRTATLRDYLEFFTPEIEK